LDNFGTFRCEDNHGALDKEDGCEGDRNHAPEARSGLLDIFELIVEDEEECDGQVEKDEEDLYPAVKEPNM